MAPLWVAHLNLVLYHNGDATKLDGQLEAAAKAGARWSQTEMGATHLPHHVYGRHDIGAAVLLVQQHESCSKQYWSGWPMQSSPWTPRALMLLASPVPS